MATYMTAARREAEAAQAVLAEHPGGIRGECLRCAPYDVCPRHGALSTLDRLGLLPRRRPGATRAGLRRVYGDPLTLPSTTVSA